MKTYSFKLYNNKKKFRQLNRRINLAGSIYNYCISLHKRYYRRYGKHLNHNRLSKQITKRKKLKPWWKELNSQAIQDVNERITKAYKLFFKEHGKGCRPPNFQSTRKYKSITYKTSGYKLGADNTIQLQGKDFKFHKSREIQGKIKTVTLKRNTLGEFYIYIVTDYVNLNEFRSETGKIAGFDFGLKTFLIGSDGNTFKSPLFFYKYLAKLRKANKFLSKKKKGSNNRRKARLALARVHKRIKNLREDFHWKLANTLCSEYDALIFEDLNIAGMKKLWGRKISDLGFCSFMLKLDWIAKKNNVEIFKIDKWYPSSKTCSCCGYVHKELELKDREWICKSCGTKHDRDLNAAINIAKEGASSFNLEIVRLALASSLA